MAPAPVVVSSAGRRRTVALYDMRRAGADSGSRNLHADALLSGAGDALWKLAPQQQLVTENRVSEVMEPVTTMQTSSYYDPCSCGYHNVTTPVTTMVRKQVVTPIQRYVTQHYTVPVTDVRADDANRFR